MPPASSAPHVANKANGPPLLLVRLQRWPSRTGLEAGRVSFPSRDSVSLHRRLVISVLLVDLPGCSCLSQVARRKRADRREVQCQEHCCDNSRGCARIAGNPQLTSGVPAPPDKTGRTHSALRMRTGSHPCVTLGRMGARQYWIGFNCNSPLMVWSNSCIQDELYPQSLLCAGLLELLGPVSPTNSHRIRQS